VAGGVSLNDLMGSFTQVMGGKAGTGNLAEYLEM